MCYDRHIFYIKKGKESECTGFYFYLERKTSLRIAASFPRFSMCLPLNFLHTGVQIPTQTVVLNLNPESTARVS